MTYIDIAGPSVSKSTGLKFHLGYNSACFYHVTSIGVSTCLLRQNHADSREVKRIKLKGKHEKNT